MDDPSCVNNGESMTGYLPIAITSVLDNGFKKSMEGIIADIDRVLVDLREERDRIQTQIPESVEQKERLLHDMTFFGEASTEDDIYTIKTVGEKANRFACVGILFCVVGQCIALARQNDFWNIYFLAATFASLLIGIGTFFWDEHRRVQREMAWQLSIKEIIPVYIRTEVDEVFSRFIVRRITSVRARNFLQERISSLETLKKMCEKCLAGISIYSPTVSHSAKQLANYLLAHKYITDEEEKAIQVQHITWDYEKCVLWRFAVKYRTQPQKEKTRTKGRTRYGSMELPFKPGHLVPVPSPASLSIQ